MDAKTYSRQNIDFLLNEVLDVNSLVQHEYFNAHSAETFAMTLDMAADISDRILLPNFVDSDRKQPELENGQVKVHKGVHQFVKAYSEAGLLASPFPFEYDGQQLPKTVFAATEYITASSHNSFVMFTDLTGGSAGLILKFGTDEQKDFYLPKMLSGKWLGTMCLTEPQAGSSLSDISTVAIPQADGTYKIVGQKIFISAGDQDITDNIIHLVLARIEGAPKGTKGISLFIVPKNRIDDNNVSNDVSSIGIFHKMGQKATPALHLAFGEKENCIGYLLGIENQGLPQMFQMMNGARLGVGMAGVAAASAAYFTSLNYAKERPQGRKLDSKVFQENQALIIEHPDVRRMLLSQKAMVEGGLALLLQCYLYLDLLKVSTNADEIQKYDALLELLTPVAKTYGAEMGIVSVNLGMQVLGGYGYTEDFVLEQLARDVRITSIYEGTTGIQAQAVLGRQITRNNGIALVLWQEEVNKVIEAAKKHENLVAEATKLEENLKSFKKTTYHLLGIAAKGNAEVFMADATLYLEYFGILNVAWQWLLMAVTAANALAEKADESGFYEAKIKTMKFFYKYELSKTAYLANCLTDEQTLTIKGDGVEL